MGPVVFQPENDASALVTAVTGQLLRRSAAGRTLAERLQGVGVRFADVLDVLHVPPDAEFRRKLVASGFERLRDERAQARTELWEHPRAL
ncbi:MAG TPA: hypothetical protein VLJ38_21240, partial [Polyangiaceae bacterium]|nr:hypothetical protein [Polyangiaceae bacterium]